MRHQPLTSASPPDSQTDIRELGIRGRFAQKFGGGRLLSLGLAAAPMLIALPIAVSDRSGPVMAAFLVVILFACSLALLVLELSGGLGPHKAARLSLYGGFFFWYSYPGFLTVIQGRSWGEGLPIQVPPLAVARAVMYLSAFLATSILIYMVSSPRRPDSTSPHNKQFVNTGYVVVLAVIAIFIGFIPYLLTGENLNGIINTILSSRAADKPWAHESSLGNTDSALFYLTSSGMIGGAVILWTAALLDFRLRHNQRLALGLIAFVTTLVVFFEQGTRSLFFLIVVPPLALVFLRLWNRSRLQITLLALIALFFLLAAAQFQRLYRSEYTRDEINLDQVLTDIATLGGNVDFFKETAYSVALVPEYHDYFYESALMMFAVSPIPRFFWPEKPAPQLVRYYTFTRWGIDNQVVVGNMQPGIVGQHYLSWGWPGPIFAGLIVGWLARRIDNLLMRFQTDISMYFSVVCLMTVCWLFLTFRLLSPGFFYPVILCILIVMITRANTSDKYAPASDV